IHKLYLLHGIAPEDAAYFIDSSSSVVTIRLRRELNLYSRCLPVRNHHQLNRDRRRQTINLHNSPAPIGIFEILSIQPVVSGKIILHVRQKNRDVYHLVHDEPASSGMAHTLLNTE